MKKTQQCPICFGELELIECAPCDCAGGVPIELENFKAKKHTYGIYRVYQDLTLRLCTFCAVDFGSICSEYLGFQHGERIGYEHMEILESIEQDVLEKDLYCRECRERLSFLKFLRDIRELNKGG